MRSVISFAIILAIGTVQIFSEIAGVILFSLLEVMIFFQIPLFQYVRGDAVSNKPIAWLNDLEPRYFRALAFLFVFLIPYAFTKSNFLNFFTYYGFCLVENIIIMMNGDKEAQKTSRSNVVRIAIIFVIFFAAFAMLGYNYKV